MEASRGLDLGEPAEESLVSAEASGARRALSRLPRDEGKREAEAAARQKRSRKVDRKAGGKPNETELLPAKLGPSGRLAVPRASFFI